MRNFARVPALQCMPLPKGYDFVAPRRCRKCCSPAGTTSSAGPARRGREHAGARRHQRRRHGDNPDREAAARCARVLRPPERKRSAGSAAISAPRSRSTTGRDWSSRCSTATEGRGVDVILDGQAGPYTDRELQLLAFDGRLVLIASHLGERADINVRQIVRRRLTLTGSTIRPRPPAYKGGSRRRW